MPKNKRGRMKEEEEVRGYVTQEKIASNINPDRNRQMARDLQQVQRNGQITCTAFRSDSDGRKMSQADRWGLIITPHSFLFPSLLPSKLLISQPVISLKPSCFGWL